MNSDTRHILSQFDTCGSFDQYQPYVGSDMRDRFPKPSVLVTVILLAATIVYQAAYQQGRVPWLPHLLWDSLVSAIPARLLFAIERFLKPSLFPAPMSRTQTPTHAAKSEALRRVLGLDNAASILGSVSQAGRKGLVTLSNVALVNMPTMSSISKTSMPSMAWRGTGGEQPPGLGNYDNSCYQNSILQGLASLKSLQPYLLAVSEERDPDAPAIDTAETLRHFMAQLNSPASNGKTLWTPKMLKNMSTWQQQDAQEYYSKLLDQVNTEITRAARASRRTPGFESDEESAASQHSEDSGYHSADLRSKPETEPRHPRHPLEGLMAQRVACVNCGHCEGLTMIPFNCLTLNLGSLSVHDLYERLDNYTKIEAIPGVECTKCTILAYRDQLKALAERTGLLDVQKRLRLVEEILEEETFDDETLKKCNITSKMRANSTKTKQVALSRPPRSLVFHINRSGFDESTGYMFKNSAAVRFPMILDMGPWCLGSADSAVTVREGGKVEIASPDEERWTLDPKSSMVAGDRQPSKFTGPIYELRAVVTHFGHHENGHYVCYRRHALRPASKSPIVTQNGMAKKPLAALLEEAMHAHDVASGSETNTPSNSIPSPDEPRTQWWRFSDEDVYEVDEQTVLAQGGVFMLFYDCVDPSLVLVSALDEAEKTPETKDSQATEVPNGYCITPLPPQSPPSEQEPAEPHPESSEHEVPLVYADISSFQEPIAILPKVGGGFVEFRTGVQPRGEPATKQPQAMEGTEGVAEKNCGVVAVTSEAVDGPLLSRSGYQGSAPDPDTA
ncbi:hypothetical protein VTI74DRAFT_9881 [Chaetomium olivicolor]